MAEFNSDILDSIDDLLTKVELKQLNLTLSQLERLLRILARLDAIATEELKMNQLKIFKSQLECRQAQCCYILFTIRIKALMLEAHGENSDDYVVGCFTKKAIKAVR